MSSFQEKRNARCKEQYEVRFVSFQLKGGHAFSPLSVGLDQKVEEWHLDLLQKFIDEKRAELEQDAFADLV